MRFPHVPDDRAVGLYGYTLVFGGSDAWIGDGRYLFMRGVDAVWTKQGPELPLFPGLDASR